MHDIEMKLEHDNPSKDVQSRVWSKFKHTRYQSNVC